MADRGDFSVSDFIMGEFLRQHGYAPKEPAPLRIVTADNAHEFTPAPRKRGRPRKVDARDNVVEFRRPSPPKATPTDFVTEAVRSMALAAQQQREEARRARKSAEKAERQELLIGEPAQQPQRK